MAPCHFSMPEPEIFRLMTAPGNISNDLLATLDDKGFQNPTMLECRFTVTGEDLLSGVRISNETKDTKA